MRKPTSRLLTVASAVSTCCLLVFAALPARAECVEFSSDAWNLRDAVVSEHLGRMCLSGRAVLKNVEFENGVIEVDLAVDGSRSYPGLLFRGQSDRDHERFYVRPHVTAQQPDALQYAPVFNGATCWQLYSGAGFTARATLPPDEWIHLKMEVQGTQARVFLANDPQPALVIHDLKHGLSKGFVGVDGPLGGKAHFSNFCVSSGEALEFDPPPPVSSSRNTLTEWQVSQVLPVDRIDLEQYPGFYTIFRAGWQNVTSEPSGLVNISRYAGTVGQGPQCVLARTIVASSKTRDVKLSFGYSDNVTLFLNGKPVFSGRSAYHSRDPSFSGIIGLHDDVFITLHKGHNELLFMVTDNFGGAGVMSATSLRVEHPTIRQGLAVQVWETPAEFNIPESVLYDPARDILYVSNFAAVGRSAPGAGFLSRVRLDGQIDNLRWVTDLDGPCGMAINGDRLFVAEGTRGNLAEIDLNTGAIVRRTNIAGATFLNDVAVDGEGYVYVSDTTRAAKSKDIYRCKDGTCELWQHGREIHRANGLFVHNQSLLVGNSGDGFLKAVNLQSGAVDSVACLGAGIIDGIRVDNNGGYLVSHWEGQVYRVSPAGEVVQFLDTQNEGINVADFEFVKHENLLVVPTFLGNKVVAYRLNDG